MNIRIGIGVAVVAVGAGIASGQGLQRRATLTGGNGDRGKCTIEVVVDGAAEVQVRGDTATLRNLWGQPPEWRRFECSGVMPANPADFRFAGVDGRGKVNLTQDPRNGGVAVVRIDDPKAGTEGYTFDLTWSGGGAYPNQSNGRGQDRGRGQYNGAGQYNDGGQDRGAGQYSPGQDRGPGQYNGGGQDRGGNPDRRWTNRPADGDREMSGRFSTDQAVRVCQDAVRQQAGERLRARDIAFRRTALDDSPGRRDWVLGTFDVRRGDGREESYRFSCSVNFENGSVRSAQIDALEGGGAAPGYDRREGTRNGDVLQACQRGVEDRLRRDGYDRMDFQGLRVDDRPGGNDAVIGNVRAARRDGSDSMDFSCAVNLESGEVRSVDVRRR